MSHPAHTPLVLASSSPYRRLLLDRLALPYIVDQPEVNEAPLPGETQRETAVRLALLKASTVARRHPTALVIGSDQVASCRGKSIGKPGTHERALEQLELLSGQHVQFHTALCLFDAVSGSAQNDIATVEVTFRKLGRTEIEQYLLREQPYDCAGSAKVEGLGITLLERVDSDDPTALVGLPLIRLVSMLRAAGHTAFTFADQADAR